jgi:uncharacterized membrane protein YeaQ/YmgE (transglycosylase-associated protein family)
MPESPDGGRSATPVCEAPSFAQASPYRREKNQAVPGWYTGCSGARGERSSQETVMSIIAMIVLGLVAGAVAKLIMPGRDPGGIVWTILLGIAGSLLGGLLFNAIGVGGGERWAGLIGSVIGAIILLWLYRIFAGRHRGTRPPLTR